MRDVQRGETVLQVPRSISHAGSLGRSVSFVQLIATLANCSTNLQVRTTLSVNSHDDHQSFVSRLHGLAAAYYADRITAKDGTTNLRRALLNAATPRILAMNRRQFDKSAKGLLTELVFVHKARYEFHPSAYKRKPAIAEIMDPELHGKLIVSRGEMNALIVKVLNTLNLREGDFFRLRPVFDRPTGPFGQVLHETFRNTAEHAYLEPDGQIPQKGIRCILIALHRISQAELQPQALVSEEHPHLESYFQRLRDRASSVYRKLVSILELSVLDTGPGFADTMQHLDTDDVARVLHCFSKHGSSKPGPNSGLGLGRVLSFVHELEGFVRFRTSTTEAFFSSNMTPMSDTQLIPHVAGKLPKATGTALTIGIPLAL